MGIPACRAARGCPCPVAGRSLRASCPPLARCFLRFAILARGRNKRRLPGHGQPRAPCSQWPRFSTRVPCHGQDGDAARNAVGPDGRQPKLRLPRPRRRRSSQRRRPGWPATQTQAATAKMAPQLAMPPARMAGNPNSGCNGQDGVAAVSLAGGQRACQGCNGQDGVAAVKRRARDSNPQPISRHLISSQTASRSLTLRGRV